MKELKEYVRSIKDFPKKGIIFRDVTSLLQDKYLLELSINKMQKCIKDINFDVIVSPESRGFIFGMPIAYNMKKAFVPVRKKGKLPYETIEESYDLEYGKATLEIHKDSIKKGDKIIIVDDLMATGGTIEAIIKLVKRLGGEVVGICCLMELPELKGREKLKEYNIYSVISFDGK